MQGRARQQISLANNGQRLYTYSRRNRPATRAHNLVKCWIVPNYMQRVWDSYTYCAIMNLLYSYIVISLFMHFVTCLVITCLHSIETVLQPFIDAGECRVTTAQSLRVRTLWFVCTTRLFILHAAGFARLDRMKQGNSDLWRFSLTCNPGYL